MEKSQLDLPPPPPAVATYTYVTDVNVYIDVHKRIRSGAKNVYVLVRKGLNIFTMYINQDGFSGGCEGCCIGALMKIKIISLSWFTEYSFPNKNYRRPFANV